MPHINHRRGDTRRRSKTTNHRHWIAWGSWNKRAGRKYRAAVRHVLNGLRTGRVEPGEEQFKLVHETDDYWFYD